MASTRDKNSQGNYALEQRALKRVRENLEFYNGPNGHAYKPALPEFYNISRIPADVLSSNPTDIESSLWGINSGNLVSPMPKVVPHLKKLSTVSFFETQEVVPEVSCKINNTERPVIY